MKRVDLAQAQFEYEVHGSGEPVLLIHGSGIADEYVPLIREPAFGDRYQFIRYRRRGYAGSSPAESPVSIALQASDARALLEYLKIEQAHVVGHSYGGPIALQLAVDAPAVVHSLALLEPTLFMVPSAQAMFEQMTPIFELHQKGNKAEAVEAFVGAIAGPDYRAALDRNVPGGHEQAIAAADTFFLVEMPALQAWNFTADDAVRITKPVLYVLAGNGLPVFREGRDLIHRWLPQTEDFVLPGTSHLLHIENPSGMAEALAKFFARHPSPVTVSSGT